MSDRQRCVFYGNQYSSLIQVQNTVLFLKDLKKKKKHIFRSIFFSIKKMSSFLSTIMKEGKYLLQMLLNRVRQRV